MKAAWSRNGNSLIPVEKSSLEDYLGNKVYLVKQDDRGSLYMDEFADDFELPAKVYGMEADFIERVKKTYEHTTGNLGILLNGEPGTGKSVTAKQISNNMGLPVLIVNADYGKLLDFISNIQQDITIFLDEFEKVFKRDEEGDANDKLLTIMDGVMKSQYRRVFLLTTNNAYVHEAMLQRPGRIRYKKEFGNLPVEAIREIVDDMLQHPELRTQTVTFISKLELITVDTVTSVVKEVNIHHESPEAFASYFNVREDLTYYNIIHLEAGGKRTQVASRMELRTDPMEVEEYDIIYTKRVGLGTVIANLEGEATYTLDLSAAGKKMLKITTEQADLIFERATKDSGKFMMGFGIAV